MRDFSRDINIKKYLPPVSRDSIDVQRAMDIDNRELQELWNVLCEILANQFIRLMNTYGVEEWEKTLSIIKLDSQTIAMRKEEILTILRGQRPYTLRSFRRMLENIFGKGIIDVKVINSKFELWITIEPDISYRVNDIRELADKIVPLNLLIFIQELRQTSLNRYQGICGRVTQTFKAKGGSIAFEPIESNEYYSAYARLHTIHVTKKG